MKYIYNICNIIYKNSFELIIIFVTFSGYFYSYLGIERAISLLEFILVKLCGLTGLSEVQYRRLQGVSPL